MANLFDVTQAPTTEPDVVSPGDFIQWKRIDIGTDYPNTAYTATYVARITGGGNTEIQVTGTASGSDYLFSVDSTTSTEFVVGLYHWQLEIKRNSDNNRIIIDRGYFTCVADLDVNGADPRTHAEIMVSKIESILSGKADSDVASYSVAGRSLSKMSFQDLIDARDYYKREVQKEVVAERIRKGQPTGSTIQVRFGGN
jgi:hypothetical protein